MAVVALEITYLVSSTSQTSSTSQVEGLLPALSIWIAGSSQIGMTVLAQRVEVLEKAFKRKR
ncbi:MAG: hypothetical protein F6K09_01640 [Merismopedia sp. SIO2A8]|nr:hypothetical protein [Merismopedia sp. SIO2A8]